MAPREPWWAPILVAILDILSGRAFAAGRESVHIEDAAIVASAKEKYREIASRPLGTDDAFDRLQQRADAVLSHADAATGLGHSRPSR